MKLGSAIAALLGLVLAIVLFERSGVGPVLALLSHAGFGVALVVLWHPVQLVCSALAWRAIGSEDGRRPGAAAYTAIRWIREGVNNLLPVAQIGGEVVGARLVARRGVPLAVASAGVVCDLTMEVLTEIGFVLLGLALLVETTGNASAVRPALGFALAISLGAGLFILVQWFGLARLETVLMRVSARFGWTAVGEFAGLEEALKRLWRRPRAVARAAFWHGLSWVLGGPEVWLALHFLAGHAPPIDACLVIESLGQALKTAGFAVPGAIGVQEGGYVLVCSFYGIPSDTAIALSLVKRVREFVLGVPSLIAWQIAETRSPLPAAVAEG